MPTILLIEDDPATQLLHETYLANMGTVVSFDDGAAAWHYLTSGGKADLIVTDHEMPVMTGRELLQHIRSGPEQIASIPVIVITASITVDELSPHRVDSFVEKPVSRLRLCEIVRELLERPASLTPQT